jgi:hypothetical protein
MARADLRSYALRRCIRFYAGLLLFFAPIATVALLSVAGPGQDGGGAVARRFYSMVVFATGASLLAVLVAVEVASGIVMTAIAKARDATPGPETPLWRFAQGPRPSWIAAAFFAVLAGILAFQAFSRA